MMDAWKKFQMIFSQMVVKNGDLPWQKVKNQLKHIQAFAIKLSQIGCFQK